MTEKATSIKLFNFSMPQMRAFHMTWVAFFLCFFGWFGVAPLTSVIQKDLNLTDSQVADTIIASVAMTIVARLLIGKLCDRYGPRRTYTVLLLLGALPVAAAGLANSYVTFLLARLAISTIGASFVITQYHTSAMFAANCVGTANATAAGWGNMGAGATNAAMPLVVAAIAWFGVSSHYSWRLAMLVPALLMIACGIAYFFLTQDTPSGNFSSQARESTAKKTGSFRAACKDYRVWALAIIYGACFGIEIIIHNSAATYFQKHFELSLASAGLIAGLFGGLALFARALGGVASDWVARRSGLKGRAVFLGIILGLQGLAMIFFSRMDLLAGAVVGLMAFGLFVHMAAGATYSVIPFVNKTAIGSVAGIVGAGGNAGAVAAGFLLKTKGLAYADAILYLGIFVALAAPLALLVRFSQADEAITSEEVRKAVGVKGTPAPQIPADAIPTP
jgi:NNP family nitrate/nitrite transporter-like MFS transporter